jgi:ribosomal protein S27AE
MTFIVDDLCPKCGRPVHVATIELHPDHHDLAVHNYQCGDCGPVKTKTYSLKMPKSLGKIAA